MLLEVSVEQLSDMISVQLSVITEGLKESADFKHTHIIDMVLQFCRPEIDPIKRALIALVVGPESTKSDPTAHVFARHGTILRLKLFENGGVVDSSDCHVVHDVGHLLQGQIIPITIVAVLDVSRNATIDVLLVVLVEEWVSRVVLVLPVFESGVLATNGVCEVLRSG